MSWFKIDDGFHCHPKVLMAGTPAVGLYVRCGSWAAQQVTDGVVPKHVAKMYGTPRMIKALVDAGLWHQKGHDCHSCPEVDGNSYVIHQYLEKNPSRAETDAARKAKSERQQRWREGKRTTSVDADVDASTRGADEAREANSEANSHRVASNLNGNSHRVEVEFASSYDSNSEQARADGDTSSQVTGIEDSDVDADVDASTPRHGDAAPVPTRPDPSSLTEKKISEPARTDVERVCRHLATVIEKGGGKRPPITKKWRTDTRLLLDRDGITPEQAIAAIDWAHNDQFWNAHILSPAKLREKYETLRRQATGRRGPSRPPTSPNFMTEEEQQRALQF